MKRNHVTLLSTAMATLFALCFVCSSCGDKAIELPTEVQTSISNKGYARVNKDKTLNTEEGEYIIFGSYPQAKVKETEMIESNREWVPFVDVLSESVGTVPTKGEAQGWTNYEYYVSSTQKEYMWYRDIEYSGEKYRGVYFTDYRPYWISGSGSAFDSYQDNNGYRKNHIYWFRYQPIEWRILYEEDGQALLLCERLIDSQEFHYPTPSKTTDGKMIYSNNYAESTIRAWLNDIFYNTAFNDLEKSLIEESVVANGQETTQYGDNPYACQNTTDNIFLLNWQDTINKKYGFDEMWNVYDVARQKETSDYAQCQGAATINMGTYKGKGYWWLRSPSAFYDDNASYIGYDGYAGIDYHVEYTNAGVCPALNMRLL